MNTPSEYICHRTSVRGYCSEFSLRNSQRSDCAARNLSKFTVLIFSEGEMASNGTSEDTKIVIESPEIEMVEIENGIDDYTLYFTLKIAFDLPKMVIF